VATKSLHSVVGAAVQDCLSPQWVSKVQHSYEVDSVAQTLLAKLRMDPAGSPPYTLRDGLIRYKGRLWIGNDAELHKRLLTAMHSSTVGGHSGIPVTYRRAKKHFAWTGMKAAIQTFVSECLVCQQAKPDRSKLPGLLQPLPVPERAWKVVSLDFVEGLPLSEGRNCILVVVDLFTKYAHFLSLRHPFTAATMAKLFISQVYRLHGMPTALVSDRDKIFTSALWRELFKLAKVELHMSTAYHPQSDG
jgi:transposase InsO family protein